MQFFVVLLSSIVIFHVNGKPKENRSIKTIKENGMENVYTMVYKNDYDYDYEDATDFIPMNEEPKQRSSKNDDKKDNLGNRKRRSLADGCDTGAPDTGASDTGAPDTGTSDTGAADTGASDTGAPDTGASDTGAPDTGASDTGAPDTGSSDTGAPDTGASDTGAPDTGASDTGASDTGASDTGAPDTGGSSRKKRNSGSGSGSGCEGKKDDEDNGNTGDTGDSGGGGKTCGLVPLGESIKDGNMRSWVIMGGYTGWEGAGGGAPIQRNELLAFKDGADLSSTSSWCQKNMSSFPVLLEGATINFLPLSGFIARNSKQASFKCPHPLYTYDQVVICGGADQNFKIQDRCRWWDPVTDKWSPGTGGPGFHMLRPRYHAASVVLPRGLWMLGGRDGSNILYQNEFMLYPHKKALTHIKNWAWVHEKSSYPMDWSSLKLPENMMKLPMPLTGHCAVRVGPYTAVLGGATTYFDRNGMPELGTGPFPTGHVHLFDHRYGKWVSTFQPTDEPPDKKAKWFKKIEMMSVARMNHDCMVFKVGEKNKVIVVGGLNNNSATTHMEPVDSVEILDFASGTWVEGWRLPLPLLGVKLIKLDNTPVVIGRYGEEFTDRILRYNPDNLGWDPLPPTLLQGRSDPMLIEVPGGAKCP